MMQYFSKNRSRIGLGIALTLLTLWLQRYGTQITDAVIDRLDSMAYDLRLNLTLPASQPADSPVAILDIDEASLRAEGRWPWSRQKMGKLVAALKAAGVNTIGFDVANPADRAELQCLAERTGGR